MCDTIQCPEKICTYSIHFVYETDPWDSVAVSLPPNGLGLRFDTCDGIEYHHAAIENSKASLDLGRKVDVAGRVDDVDRGVLPPAGDRGRVDRDAATGFVGIEVRDRRPVVDAAEPVRMAADAGAQGLLLTDVPVGADPNVEDAVRSSKLDLIPLIAPTTRPERASVIAENGQGFVYYISRTGVTGAREVLTVDLENEVRVLRERIGLPLAVGFGISTPEQAASVSGIADGVVVDRRLELGRSHRPYPPGTVAAGQCSEVWIVQTAAQDVSIELF